MTRLSYLVVTKIILNMERPKDLKSVKMEHEKLIVNCKLID